MKKLIAIGLVLMSSGALADWVKLGENLNGTVYYVDPSTKKGGNRPRVWLFTIYGQQKSNGTRSYRALVEADCLEGSMRDLATTYYFDANLEKVKSHDSDPDPWSYPAPETVRESLYIYLCGKSP